MIFLAIAIAVTQADLAAPLLPLFGNEKEALAFSTTFGPDWRNPLQVKLNTSGPMFGFKMKMFEYRLQGGKAYVGIGTGPFGKIGFYDVRFPSVGTKCIVPDTNAMAKALLAKFEPAHASDSRNVNRVASTANLVWPYTAFHGSPPAVVGNTVFESLKMNGYCRLRVFRHPSATT